MKSLELRLQRVGGKSETEIVINQSLSSTVAKRKGQNLLAREEKEARLRACILQPIVYSWAWYNINHCCSGSPHNAVHFPSNSAFEDALQKYTCVKYRADYRYMVPATQNV